MYQGANMMVIPRVGGGVRGAVPLNVYPAPPGAVPQPNSPQHTVLSEEELKQVIFQF